MRLSVIVPVLDEAAGIGALMQSLAGLREQGHEIIVVDGGSCDDTVAQARSGADQVLQAPRGRARQMNAGAAVARGDVLVFLHADTVLPTRPGALIEEALHDGIVWGRFDVRIVGASRWLPMVARFMNLRSRLTGIATGDQAIFVRRDAFQALGGYPDQPLMEDIELSRRLRARGRPACLAARVQTSGRRWDQRGALRTIVLMWRLRWRYWRGEAPEALARAYR